MTYAPQYLEPLSSAVGRVVIEWNRVEEVLVELAHRLAGCLNPAHINDESDALRIALMNSTLMDRIETVRVFAHKAELREGFYDELDNLLKKLSKTFREERNEFVHSLWYCDFGNPYRVKVQARVRNSQSRSKELTLYKAREYASIEEVAQLGQELCGLYDALSKLEGEVSLSDAYGRTSPNSA